MTKMLKCNEVSRLAASEEINEAGLFRRMEFRLHLMMCRHCRNYVHQVGLIGETARRLVGEDDDAVVARLEDRVLKTFHGHPKPGNGSGG
jgi:hypothetical protein